MKNKFLHSVMFLLLVIGLYSPVSYSQLPAYTMTFTNDTLYAPGNVYEFDIILARTGTNIFQLYGVQLGIYYDNAFLNGGTLTASWVPGSNDPALVAAAQVNTSFGTATAGIIKIAPKIQSTFGNGCIIPLAPGLRVGRLRLTSTAYFTAVQPNIHLSYTTIPYKTAIFAFDYTTHLNSEITDPACNIINLSGWNPFPALNVTSPNGGENLSIGSTKKISWTYNPYVTTNVKIEYTTNGGTSWLSVINSIPAGNSPFSWTIPNTPSTNCKVKISDAGNPGYFVTSGNTFSILLSLFVQFPDGGENLSIGSTQNISWIYNPLVTTNVKIEYTTNGGTSWLSVINSIPAGNSPFSWTIPNTPSTNCKVKISDADNPGYFVTSENAFAILSILSINPCPGIPTVDYVGKTYHTVAIGDQCWLKENLDVGTRINNAVQQTNNSDIEKYCYNNDSVNCSIYGGLYQWAEAVAYTNGATNNTDPSPAFTGNIQGICPPGWHIPTSAEYQTLNSTVSNNSKPLLALGQGTGSDAGTNVSGFSALLAGYRDLLGPFEYLGTITFFWSSTDSYEHYAYRTFLLTNDSSINIDTWNKEYGLSVRCLNDMSVSTLPVELGLFTATANGRTIQLNWTTQTEKNSDIFNIERKTSVTDWQKIGSAKAANLSNSPKQYSFLDKNLQSGKYNYRLKMIDNDGTFQYSKIIEAEVAVPKHYELKQNFPNPFNPNTVISYSLPLASDIRLIIYNSLGQTVQVLENGFKNAGNYSISFNASDLPSGIYCYKLEAGQFSQVRKMIILK